MDKEYLVPPPWFSFTQVLSRVLWSFWSYVHISIVPFLLASTHTKDLVVCQVVVLQLFYSSLEDTCLRERRVNENVRVMDKLLPPLILTVSPALDKNTVDKVVKDFWS
jgi:hypothetical protein